MSMKRSLPEPRELLCQPTLGALQTVLMAVLVLPWLLPVMLIVGLTKGTDWIGKKQWWKLYWARLCWHEQEAQSNAVLHRWKSYGHWVMYALLGAPLWVPLIVVWWWFAGVKE